MRILIATDGSQHSDVAVHTGAYLAQVTRGELTLITVISQEGQREQALAILSRARAILKPKATAVKPRIRTGKAAEEILLEAREGEYALIVLGDRPRHGLSALLPPTTERVIARKPCPVLIARGQARPLRRVLVCEGGREPTLLCRLNGRLAPLFASFTDVSVLHVMSQIAASHGADEWQLEAGAEELIARHTPEGQLLEQDLALLESKRIKLQAIVRHGLVVEGILAEARREDCDLVVIGAHESRGWEHYLLDDLAHEILTKIDRSVLIV